MNKNCGMRGADCGMKKSITAVFTYVVVCLFFAGGSAIAQDHSAHGAKTESTATPIQAQAPAPVQEKEAPTITISEEKRQLIGVRTAAGRVSHAGQADPDRGEGGG